MEMWTAYNCGGSDSCSASSHVQLGPFQASNKIVCRSGDQSASAESEGKEVRVFCINFDVMCYNEAYG